MDSKSYRLLGGLGLAISIFIYTLSIVTDSGFIVGDIIFLLSNILIAYSFYKELDKPIRCILFGHSISVSDGNIRTIKKCRNCNFKEVRVKGGKKGGKKGQ